MIPYRCTYCGQIRTDTADGWSYHRATTANHRGPARYSNDPSRPSIIDAAQDTERQRAHDRTARGEAARRTARALAPTLEALALVALCLAVAWTLGAAVALALVAAGLDLSGLLP